MTKFFCAIDTVSRDEAVRLATAVSTSAHGLKLGLEFFVARGPEGIEDIRRVAPDLPIFLDLKLHDIPNTVAGAVRAAARCQASFLTIHASGGLEMMKAAVQAAKAAEDETGYAAPKILGVTVLTSFDDAGLAAVGQGPAAPQVERLARLAAEAGLGGLVCSPREIAAVKQAAPGLTLVVPGIRPAGADKGDQKRTMTPPEAAALGADWLVIGRPITGAADPGLAARQIRDSIL